MFYRDILMWKQANKLDSVCLNQGPVAMYKYIHKLNDEYIKYTVNEYHVVCLWYVRIMVYIIVQNYNFFSASLLRSIVAIFAVYCETWL